MITQTEYRQRREQLMANIKQGTAIFRSAPMAVMHNDVEYNFRQDSDFFYLTGFNEANAVAVFAPHHEEHKFVLFVQPAEIEHIFGLNGGTVAYPSIVASGKNACILHYVENNCQIQNNDLLLIDAGCCCQYYNGDITRTFPVGGKFTPEQKIIYQLVLKAQLAAIEQVKPGNPYKNIHDTAVRVLVEGLMDLELLVGDIEEIIKEEKYKPFYMHRTGHWLGLDVHDVGVYQWGENPQPLQPGNILTVEPGIYISPNIKLVEGQPEIPECWHGIGVRIEDDVLVTSGGYEVLSAGVPKSVSVESV
ncbi:aminopeptidase P family protein [Planktothrix agardhii 1033]|nr:aminopeptidase P family protein [Planktothrix agardhii 1033]